MINKVIDFSDSPYYVEYPYRHAKEMFDHIMGYDKPIGESNPNTNKIPDRENPFSIYYDVN